MFDVHNAFNTATIININRAFGPAWRRPTIQGRRVFKFSVQVDF